MGLTHEYLIGRRVKLHISGEPAERWFEVGDTLPAEEVEGWGERSVRHLTDNDYIVPVRLGVVVPQDPAHAAAGEGVTGDGGAAAAVPAATEEADDTVSEGEDAPYPRHLGHGRYLLSTGDQVQGRKNAYAAQAEVDA